MPAVDLVTIHHEGSLANGGAPTDDVGRFREGGYCCGLGATLFERWRAPADNYATLNLNGQDWTPCYSGDHHSGTRLRDEDIELLHAAYQDAYERGEVTAEPLVRAHRDSPGSATACPGDYVIERWADVVAACRPGRSAPPAPADVEPEKLGGAMQLVRTKTGKGYWICASDGGVFSYGDAAFYGSMGSKPLTAPVSGMAATPTGKGYVLCAEDGGVFAFGDAVYLGGMGGKKLNAPVVDIEYDVEGDGYWLLARDGGVFTFGKTAFYGAATGKVKTG